MTTTLLQTSKLIFYVVVFFILHVTVSGQTNFRKSKIVTLAGDTINGMIDDQEKLINPRTIPFIKEGATVIDNYKPSEIKAAIIDSGDYYLAAIIEIDMNYGKSLKMDEAITNDTIIKTDTVFLRVILQSKLSLFLFNDENHKNHYYYSEVSQKHVELTYKKIPVTVDGKVYLKNSTRYKKQLAYLMRDCPDLNSKTDRTDYNEKDLLKLFEAYNNCQSQRILYKTNDRKKSYSIYVCAGLDLSEIKFNGTSSYKVESGNFSTYYSPTIGIGINIPFKRSRNKFGVFSELIWKNFDSKASYYIFDYTETDVHFQMNYIKLNIVLKYSYPKFVSRPYVFVGPTLNYLVGMTKDLHLYNHNPNLLPVYPRETNSELNMDPVKLSIGIIGGIGINFNRYSFEFRFDRHQPFKSTGNLQSFIDTYNFMIKYRLSK